VASLKVVPVIDVLNGVVVHAIRGNRGEYQPLKSVLTASVDPVEVASVFKLQGFSELYLADLDAISDNKLNFDLYSGLAQLGFNFMVDAGVTDIKTAELLRSCGVSKIIIGTETLQNITFIKETVQQMGAEHIIVSLDIKDGKVLTQPNFDGPTDLFSLLETFCTIGVSEFILLDLSRVGSNEGINIELLKKTLTTLNGRGVYVGGGVQTIDELLHLEELDVLGVMFATALHSGKISICDLRKANLF